MAPRFKYLRIFGQIYTSHRLSWANLCPSLSTSLNRLVTHYDDPNLESFDPQRLGLGLRDR